MERERTCRLSRTIERDLRRARGKSLAVHEGELEDATRWRRAAPHVWRPIAWTTYRRLDQCHVDLDYPVTNEETELAADVIGALLLGAKTQR